MKPSRSFVALLGIITFFFALFGISGSAMAAVIFGTTNTVPPSLLSFDSTTPGTFTLNVPVTGLQSGEIILGLDFRPASGQMYGLGSTSRLYTINTTTGTATQVGSGAFSPALSGSAFGFDFNPVSDLIRVVSDADQNFRLNPDTGAVVATDSLLNPGTPNVVGSAYTNNFAGATVTTLFGIDSNSDMLVMQGGVDGIPLPNTGTLTNVGVGLGVDVNNPLGFDIEQGTGTAFAAMNSGGLSQLFTINLTTGAASAGLLIGPIIPAITVNAMTVFLPPPAPPTPTPSADLTITKTPVPNPATCGQNVVYTITVTNNGPDAAANVVATDTIPTGLDFVSVTTSQGTCDPATVSCNLGTVNLGTPVTLNLTVTPSLEGAISNTASVTSTTADPNSANNNASATLTVTGGTCGALGGGGCSLADLPSVTPYSTWGLPLLALGGLGLRRRKK